jgi:exosortase
MLFAGEMSSTITLLHIGTWSCIVGLLMTLYGRRIQYLAFPILILFFIAPPPDLVGQMLKFVFREAAGSLAAGMLSMSGVDSSLKGNIIDLGITHLLVNEACSGLRYLIPLFILTLLTGYFFTLGFWRRSILILSVVPLAVVLNAFRIWFTGILCINNHREFAQNFFHDISGTVIFLIAAGAVFCISVLLDKTRTGRGT